MKGRQRVSARKLFDEVSDDVIEAPAQMPDIVKTFLDWDEACATSMKKAGEKAEQHLKANPPPPTPVKLGARCWQEMKKSMNMPSIGKDQSN